VAASGAGQSARVNTKRTLVPSGAGVANRCCPPLCGFAQLGGYPSRREDLLRGIASCLDARLFA
jgi:hypothetical protein